VFAAEKKNIEKLIVQTSRQRRSQNHSPMSQWQMVIVGPKAFHPSFDDD